MGQLGAACALRGTLTGEPLRTSYLPFILPPRPLRT